MSDLLNQLNSDFKRLKKSKGNRDTLKSTSSFIADLESLYDEINQSEDNFDKSYMDKQQMKFLNEAYKSWEDTVKNDIKTTNSNIAKFGKSSIDKIDGNIDLICQYGKYNIQRSKLNLQLVDNAIKLHLIRSGDLTVVSETFVDYGNKEQDLSSRIDLNLLDKFKQMNEILGQIQNRNLKEAIEWTLQNESILVDKYGSELEFKLHRLQYLQYYSDGNTLKALLYAQQWFPKFIKSSNGNSNNDKNLSSVSKLMSSNLFTNDDRSSPYFQNNQLVDSSYKEVALLFSKEFCSVLGFAFESSIFTIVLSGMISSPCYQKYVDLTTKNPNSSFGWTSKDELPFEINLPSFLRKYHPIFICPVSKQETTLENPPMSLPCHHIISRDSLEKLSRHGSNFKCPYCPTNCMASQCKQVTFHHI